MLLELGAAVREAGGPAPRHRAEGRRLGGGRVRAGVRSRRAIVRRALAAAMCNPAPEPEQLTLDLFAVTAAEPAPSPGPAELLDGGDTVEVPAIVPAEFEPEPRVVRLPAVEPDPTAFRAVPLPAPLAKAAGHEPRWVKLPVLAPDPVDAGVPPSACQTALLDRITAYTVRMTASAREAVKK